jgi:hypothetical protein
LNDVDQLGDEEAESDEDIGLLSASSRYLLCSIIENQEQMLHDSMANHGLRQERMLEDLGSEAEELCLELRLVPLLSISLAAFSWPAAGPRIHASNKALARAS